MPELAQHNPEKREKAKPWIRSCPQQEVCEEDGVAEHSKPKPHEQKQAFLFLQAPVIVAIGGPGLPEDVKFRDDLPKAGLANITATYINLLGYASPAHMEPSLIA